MYDSTSASSGIYTPSILLRRNSLEMVDSAIFSRFAIYFCVYPASFNSAVDKKELKREKFRRRAAIEPIIGHVKSDHRMVRNYLKGFIGDQINLLLAASAFNMKKWMNNFIQLLILLRFVVILYAITQQKQQEKEKYLQIFLLLLKL